jgi:hypothetical protein
MHVDVGLAQTRAELDGDNVADDDCGGRHY